ncbi:MAG: hypothetical protein ACYDA2_07980 [Acidimicrobiales bacterium]
MFDPVEPLIVDLLEWIGPRPRPYAEVLEVWRTSCPRLPVWEEARARGFVVTVQESGRGFVTLSEAGIGHLRRHRPAVSFPCHDEAVARPFGVDGDDRDTEEEPCPIE